MGKFKEMDIEQKELVEDVDYEEMWERHIIASAVGFCKRKDYGYSKFLDELHKALNEARGKEV